MLTPFDDLEERVFGHVLDLMGESALWQSSDGATITGLLLFNNPTMPSTIGQSDEYLYKPVTPTAEYYRDAFVGLKEATDKQYEEFLIIREKKYLVTKVEAKFDGDTYIATLELV